MSHSKVVKFKTVVIRIYTAFNTYYDTKHKQSNVF